MRKPIKNQYAPDQVSPPGETLAETLEALGLPREALAKRIGHPKELIDDVITGKSPITPQLALAIEAITGVSASFWNNRERHFREALAAMDQNRSQSIGIDIKFKR